MLHPASTALRIVSNEQAGLSKAQIKFNTLIKKIEAERKSLATWQETVSTCHTRLVTELDPLLETLVDVKIAFLLRLDGIASNKAFTPNQRKKISQIICAIAADLLGDIDSEPVKKVYAQHSGRDVDADLTAERDAMMDFVESMFGIDLSEARGAGSPDDVMAQLAEKMRAESAQFQAHRQARDEANQETPPAKKSAKTRAREAREQKEASHISQSIRDVYRKLASALHPDREPDAAERDRKTTLMQRVNVAYDKKDLLQLLELQLEIEQIDPASIRTMSEERLKYYNKILAGQLAELQAELRVIQTAFSSLSPFDMRMRGRLSPEVVLQDIDHQVADIQADIADIKNDLASIDDVGHAKAWLKSFKMARPRRDEDGWW